MEKKDHYLLLDAARGIAAFIVMLYHIKIGVAAEAPHPFGPEFLRHSFLAVDLFFLMSGLVVARSYESRLLDKSMTFLSFCRIRFIRLWPLYAAGTLLGFLYVCVCAMMGPDESFPVLEASFTFFLNSLFIPYNYTDSNLLYPFNLVAWSLGLEVAINIIYALCAVRFSTRSLSLITLISGLLLIVSVLLYGSADMGCTIATLAGGCLRMIFSFTFGVLLFRTLPGFFIKIPTQIWPVLLIGLLIILMTPFGDPGPVYDLFCIILIFPLFVLVSCFITIPDAIRKIFDYFGRISYPVYILHIPLFTWLMAIYKSEIGHLPTSAPFLSIPLLCILIISISHIACVYFDEPIQSYWRKKLKGDKISHVSA